MQTILRINPSRTTSLKMDVRYNTLFRRIALLVALIVAVGNISFPVAVLTGMVG